MNGKSGKNKGAKERRPIPEFVLTAIQEHLDTCAVPLCESLELGISEDGCGVKFFMGDVSVAGEFTHGDAASAWIDGFVTAYNKAAQTIKDQDAKNIKREVHVIHTGHFFHLHVRNIKFQKWERVDHAHNPAMSMAAALAIAIELWGHEGFHVSATVNKVVQSA